MKMVHNFYKRPGTTSNFFIQNIFRKKLDFEGQLPIISREPFNNYPSYRTASTWGGKSLTFTHLSQPGLCIVVDPIKSLDGRSG
jgi:hypothetical protein